MKRETELLLEACKDNIDRAVLAQNINTDPELLECFCLYDLDPMVVEEAMLNPNTEEPWVEKALERFPDFNQQEIYKKRHEIKIKIINQMESEGGQLLSGDRDQIILKHIYKEDNLENEINHANSHLGKFTKDYQYKFKNPNIAWESTDKFKVAMVIAPAWGILFPPYNMAKLTAVLRKHGYSTKVYDLNVECYHALKELHGEDYWRGERYFLWIKRQNFVKFILPYIQPVLDKAIDDIVKSNPKVIGFSIYNTNTFATKYMVSQIKKLLPDACLLAGGPEVITNFDFTSLTSHFNYLFVGEAEETLPYVLENLPDIYPTNQKIGSTDSKLKLDEYPFPDYSDYNLSNYMHQDGVSIETSRGCIAQCSFCAETYFWKFRSNGPERVVEEMEYQIKNYGVKRFWFVDSLVNGNVKNFEKLIDLIIEKNLKIKWNSYARCDGRMTKEFIKKIADSGCTAISYGVESGSQKVLNDMRKKIEIWEIENNLNDGAEVNLFNHVNYMIGFPTEEPIDYLHSMQLIANLRKSINIISPGFGAGPAQFSHMQTDWHVYGILGNNYPGDITFCNTWYTHDYKNTILHRFIRIKLFHVWLNILSEHAKATVRNSQQYKHTKKSNTDSFNKDATREEIEESVRTSLRVDKANSLAIKDSYTFVTSKKSEKKYVKQDYYVNLERYSSEDFGNSIANEFFAFAYGLHLYFDDFEYSFECDPQSDLAIFGNTLVNDYSCKFTISKNKDGNYKLFLTHKFNHMALDKNSESIYESERKKEDKSFEKTYFDEGNFNDWISSEIQVKETIHEQYRNFTKKKVIPISK